jgi:hypothetical protein
MFLVVIVVNVCQKTLIIRGGHKGVAGVGRGHPQKMRNYLNIVDNSMKL